MFKNEEIKEKIRNTNLFNDNLKQDIIWYFNFLTEIQKNNLLQALNTEKVIIQKFLSSLKDDEVIQFEEIKLNITKLQNEDRRLRELKELKDEELEINTLFDKLELI